MSRRPADLQVIAEASELLDPKPYSSPKVQVGRILPKAVGFAFNESILVILVISPDRDGQDRQLQNVAYGKKLGPRD